MKDATPVIICGTILILFVCVISNLIGFSSGIDKVKLEAVVKSHAEWVADTNGKPQFRWKECK
jgi:hypothetical protein